VTNAKGGQSFHNYRCAIDVVPLQHGKCCWDDSVLWKRIGALGKAQGLDWAGDWNRFTEFPHFQYTAGLTLAQLRKGAKIIYEVIDPPLLHAQFGGGT
jgi:peptidoglycan L-alanyl-D-glutamate endopeptidase CwlK